MTTKIAVVVPIYNEQLVLPTLIARTRAALESITDASWRIILVNDGSSDHSWQQIENFHLEDPRIVAIDLARNFGHQPAILAGLEAAANDDVVIAIDGDLQDPPELIPGLLQEWRTSGCQVVTAKRRSRQERGLRGALLRSFHRVFQWVSDFPIESDTGTYCLIDKTAMQNLLRLAERNRFFPGLRSWVGFNQRFVLYDRDDRLAGEPKQSFKRLFKYALDAIFSFSYKPLRLILVMGATAFTVGTVIAVWFGIRRMIGHESAEQGFTTLVILILMFGGSQLIAIGVLGEYLGRIYDEVKNRPHYLVRRRLGLNDRREGN